MLYFEQALVYAAFLNQQKCSLAEQLFVGYNHAWIGVPNLGWLEARKKIQGGHFEPLPDQKIDTHTALIWYDTKGFPELWVKPQEKAWNDRTYARVWCQFVQQFSGGAPMPALQGRALAIDHLYPETAAARLGLSHVRVMAVDRRANSLLGSTIETSAARDKAGSVRPRFATHFTLAKISGFQGSFGRRYDAIEIATAYLNHIRLEGLLVGIEPHIDEDFEIKFIADTIEWFRKKIPADGGLVPTEAYAIGA